MNPGVDHRLLKALLGVQLTVFNSTTIAAHTAIEALREFDRRNFRFKSSERTMLAELLEKRKSPFNEDPRYSDIRAIIEDNRYHEDPATNAEPVVISGLPKWGGMFKRLARSVW